MVAKCVFSLHTFLVVKLAKVRIFAFVINAIKMAKKRKDVTFIILSSISIGLIVIGFFTPPMWKIDGSVLQAVGLITLMYAVKQIPDALLKGKEVRLKYGSASVSMGDGKDLDKIENAEKDYEED